VKGRGGWDKPNECDVEDLAAMLVQHVEKGDPVDIANFCMMIWNRVRETGPDTYAPIVEAFAAHILSTVPAVVQMTDDAIYNFWLNRDCMDAIRAGEMRAQFISAVRAILSASGVQHG